MFARSHFLLPGLDFCLPGKSAGLENTIDETGELSTSGIDIFNVTLKAFDDSSGLIAVLVCLCSDS